LRGRRNLWPAPRRDNLIYLKKRMKQRTSRPTEPESRRADDSGAKTPAQIPLVVLRILQFLRRHALSLATGVVCLAICFWMITEGTGKVLFHRGFDAFYDGQADSLMHGHWDVSRDAIIGEDFAVNGKHYGYFGFTPALTRILLNWIFPSQYGHWTRLLMLVSIAWVMVAILVFMDEFEVPSSPFFMAAAVLGSTLLFMCSHSLVYNEAILTGAALALWAYLFFWRYLRQPRLGFLVVACLLSFLSFFARFTVGAGPQIFAAFLCLTLLFRRYANGRVPFLDRLEIPSPTAAGRHAVFLAVCLTVTALTYVSVNHAKFGTWLNPAPYEHHVQYNAERLARIEGKINHLSNIPFELRAYFGLDRMQFSRSFPWLGLISVGPDIGSPAKIDGIANYTSIPDGMPALTILSIMGLALIVRDWRVGALPMIAAAFLAGCLILPNAYIAYRYAHDFYPFLILAAILGLAAVRSISRKPVRRALWILIVTTGIWSMAANFAFALKWQRVDFGPDPVANAAFVRMRSYVDSWTSFGKLEDVQYKNGDVVGYARTGQLLNVIDPPATYRYDGHRWNYVAGVPPHLFNLLVKFPSGEPNSHMPLWFAGHFGSSDAVFIVYSNPTQVAFCSDHWGTGVVCSPAMEIQPGREYRVQINADRLNSTLTIQLDGRKVFEAPIQFHMWTDRDILVGKSLAPEAHGGEFKGEIRPDEGSK
jgi:hypothetical protein